MIIANKCWHFKVLLQITLFKIVFVRHCFESKLSQWALRTNSRSFTHSSVLFAPSWIEHQIVDTILLFCIIKYFLSSFTVIRIEICAMKAKQVLLSCRFCDHHSDLDKMKHRFLSKIGWMFLLCGWWYACQVDPS